MVTTSEWNEIREGLRTYDEERLRWSAVRVGRIKAESLPDDIADSLVDLFSHPEPVIRAEAVFAVGLHWRLPGKVRAIAQILEHDSDWHVQLRAIDALGAIGREHAGTKCFVSKSLAGVVLNERFADNERMIAYDELLHTEGRIGSKEGLALDRNVPDRLADFEVDQPWVEEMAGRKCSEP